MGPISRVAAWIAGIYLVIALAAWVLPLIAKPGESLAGIYVVPLAFPWSFLLGWIMDRFGIDSMAFNSAFLLLGILINAVILYFVLSRIFPPRAA